MLRARIQYMEYRYTVHYRGKLYTVYNSWFQAGHKQVYDFFMEKGEEIWDYSFLLSLPQISIIEKRKICIFKAFI